MLEKDDGMHALMLESTVMHCTEILAKINFTHEPRGQKLPGNYYLFNLNYQFFTRPCKSIEDEVEVMYNFFRLLSFN